MATDFLEDPAASVLKGKELRDSQKKWLFISTIVLIFLLPAALLCILLVSFYI
jgi:hypothetical protein